MLSQDCKSTDRDPILKERPVSEKIRKYKLMQIDDFLNSEIALNCSIQSSKILKAMDIFFSAQIILYCDESKAPLFCAETIHRKVIAFLG